VDISILGKKVLKALGIEGMSFEHYHPGLMFVTREEPNWVEQPRVHQSVGRFTIFCAHILLHKCFKGGGVFPFAWCFRVIIKPIMIQGYKESQYKIRAIQAIGSYKERTLSLLNIK
jgi:hypothetical protein